LVYGNNGAVPLAAPAGVNPAAKRAGGAPLRKNGFDPGEPRVPAGNPDGGQWTSDGDADGNDTESEGAGSTTGSSTPTDNARGEGDGRDGKNQGLGDDASAAEGRNGGRANDTRADLVPAAYPGDYHDAVVQALKNYLTGNGGAVITEITLTAINGTSAVADMIVRLPGAPPFILEVKTGPGAQFTDPQRIVYPMVQIGRHASSQSEALRDVGLTPGKLLPPLKVYVYWVLNPGDRGKLFEIPPPEIVP
jgi:hypothetical protein